jgi:glycosyltransferase involved in cell wall biosynthesis
MRDEKLVIHVGPYSSKGGMSRVMEQLIGNPPKNFNTKLFDTYVTASALYKVMNILNLRRSLKREIKILKPQIIHFHVTHNFSWWRNIVLIKLALKMQIPAIINIHSGKFDIFCKKYFSFPGKTLHNLSKKKLVKIVVLEERWMYSLREFATDISCIRNPVELGINIPTVKSNDQDISLLLIARDDKIKGHQFAIETFKIIKNRGFDVKLNMTGIRKKTREMEHLGVNIHGWIENHEEVKKLIKMSDFVISPSEYEGSSMSVLESMALGTIPIVSKVSSETVSIKELVIESMEPEEWADTIIDIVTNKKEKCILEKIKERIKEHDISNISSHWREQYNLIIEE